jgi:hypothetical protein
MVYKTNVKNYCLSLVALNSSFLIRATNSKSMFDQKKVTEKIRLFANLYIQYIYKLIYIYMCVCVCVCVYRSTYMTSSKTNKNTDFIILRKKEKKKTQFNCNNSNYVNICFYQFFK